MRIAVCNFIFSSDASLASFLFLFRLFVCFCFGFLFEWMWRVRYHALIFVVAVVTITFFFHRFDVWYVCAYVLHIHINPALI